MPLDNSLNVSEMLRRLGVKGDSLGSAPLLESLRLSLNIGDLSQLVPPVAGPFGGMAQALTSGVATVNKWSLHCRSPGGLRVQTLHSDDALTYGVWITPASPFGAILASDAHNYSFGQNVLSVFEAATPAAPVVPARVFRLREAATSILPPGFQNWVGPGEFFNIEALNNSVVQEISISWQEYPGAINPG